MVGYRSTGVPIENLREGKAKKSQMENTLPCVSTFNPRNPDFFPDIKECTKGIIPRYSEPHFFTASHHLKFEQNLLKIILQLRCET